MARSNQFKKKTNIDLGLAVLCVHASPGQTMSPQDIAEVCECTSKVINQIQYDALRKVRKLINFSDHLEASCQN